jgi:hypothetical protein
MNKAKIGMAKGAMCLRVVPKSMMKVLVMPMLLGRGGRFHWI